MKRIMLMFVMVLCSVMQSNAANWQSTKVEVHKGFDYLMPFAPTDVFYDATVISFSHANGWRFGDNFFWFDATRQDDPTSVKIYGEFAPRISIFKIAGSDRKDKFLSDLSIASMIEYAPADFVYLYGIGTSLKIPGFAFFNLNAYIRDDLDYDGVTFMLNSAWALPFEFGPVAMTFDGFIDIAGKEGKNDSEKENFIITQPALLLDIGNFWKKPKHLYLGTEVEIWKNKLGVKDKNDVTPQITFRWQF